MVLTLASSVEGCDKFCYEKAREKERATRASAGGPIEGRGFAGPYYGAAVGWFNAERNRIAANGAFHHNLWDNR